MLPLIPLAITLAPEIGKWLFGDAPAVGQTVSAVQAVVAAVTGTQDAAAQQALLERDPAAAATLRVQLARIAAEAEAAAARQMEAQIADVAGARAQTVALAQAGSVVAWGAPAVSVLVLLTFGVVMGLALTRSMPAGSEALLNVLLGSLAAMATSVVSYWVGSSAGSARKTAQLAQLAAR